MLSSLGSQMVSSINRAQLNFIAFGSIAALGYFRPIAGSVMLGGYALSYLIASQALAEPEVDYVPVTFRVMDKVANVIRDNPKLYFAIATLGYVVGPLMVRNLCDSCV